jgi:RHS repeat-associated protein
VSPVTLCVSAALLAACGGARDTDKAASPATESRSTSALTAAQVQAARRAQLINGYVHPTFFGPMASFPFDPNDVGTATLATGINDAGTVVGFTNQGDNLLPPGGWPGAPFIVDAGGEALLDNPWLPGPAYAVGINQHGDVLGFGGPGDGTNADFKRPVVYHPDHSFQILPLPAPPWSPVRMTPTGINDDSPTGISTVVGRLEGDAGALAVWHFDSDTSDAVGPSAFPAPANPAWTDGHRGQAIVLDGNTCLSIPPEPDTQPWQAPGQTIMAWVKLDPSMCPGGLRNVMRRSDDWGFWEDAADLSVVCNADGTAAITGDLWAGGNTGVLPPSGHIALGEWTHLAITTDSSNIIGYVNGVLVGEHATTPTLSHGPPGLAVGCRPDDPTTDFKGAIDELSLFANAMGADEIRLYYGDKTSYPVAGVVNAPGRIQQGFVDTILPPEDPGHSPWATVAGLNNAGVMAGAVSAGGAAAAAVYSPTSGWTNLNTLLAADADWNLQQATAINDAGQVVGWGLHDGRPAMFRIDAATGDIIDLGHDTNAPFSNPQLYVVPAAINASGHIAGSQFDQWPFWPLRAVIYTDETGLTDLNDLLDPEVAAAGWELRQATAINANDDVVGFAINNATGFWRAFKAHVPTLPSQTSIAVASCNGKADGDSCDGGGSCGQNNVCNAGVCGGGSAGGICLRMDGVVDLGGGRFVAVFGEDNNAGVMIRPQVNEVLVNGTVSSIFQPRPPDQLPAGSHPGGYQPTFSSGQTIAWRVDGQMVTASAASPRLATTPIGQSGLGATVGNTVITIRSDLAKYLVPPKEAALGQDPSVGGPFIGPLTGELTVTPTGGAVYTVPIAMPPGVAGMAPHLNLVYDSQGGDGIAGQGWHLTGLSSIYRCPKTRLEDGVARPVRMDDLDNFDHPGDPNFPPFDPDFDGLCLDGNRIPSGATDDPQPTRIEDFSTWGGGLGDFGQTIVLKSGETRNYGSSSKSIVTLPDLEAPLQNGLPPPQRGVIWLLDRVHDPWGNYYEIHYNDDQGDFQTRGIIVTEIDYTGHLGDANGAGAVAPFSSVKFTYEDQDRPDVRTLRFHSGRIPQPKRLSTITTPLGQYSLEYKPDVDPMLPSLLQRIKYCAGDSCMDPLEFDWEGGGYGWPEDDRFALPAHYGPTTPPSGVQLVDLDGDGRLDLVESQDHLTNGQSPNLAWRNTGVAGTGTSSAWAENDNWALPAPLVNNDLMVASTVLADMDGDGIQDVVSTVRMPSLTLGVWSNQIPTDPSCTTQCWVPITALGTLPAGWEDLDFTKTDLLADMDGDGRADLVRIPSAGQMQVLLNRGTSWLPAPEYSSLTETGTRLLDVNRDGLPDLVGPPRSDGTVSVAFNAGATVRAGTDLHTVWWGGVFVDQALITADGSVGGGDLDGDGSYDAFKYKPWTPSDCGEFASFDFAPSTSVFFGNGYGYDRADGSTLGLTAFFPRMSQICPNFYHHYTAVTDLNGDGLADIVISHPSNTNDDRDNPGQLLVNTGSAWKDLNGATNWQRDVAPSPPPVPEVPTPDPDVALGSTRAFVDLNGDGVLDLIQSTGGTTRAWINTFKKPIIRYFPDGLAAKKLVSYVSITEQSAHTQSVYLDDDPLVAGTTRLSAPLRVVQSVTSDDGTGLGSRTTTSYAYHSLRGSAAGRGPQGFHRVVATEQASGIVTTTTFAQHYPYTGRVTKVERLQSVPNNGLQMTTSSTTYCDTVEEDNQGNVKCSKLGTEYPPASVIFVYPISVFDTTYLYPENHDLDDFVTTSSQFKYDKYGNPIRITVTTTKDEKGSEGIYSKDTVNTFGSVPDGPEQRQGKLTFSAVTSSREHDPNTITHSTGFEYLPIGNGPALALSRKLVEPTAGWPIELVTAYGYDGFGNVTTTTSCANDFDACLKGAPGPADTGDAAHVPFRTTTVSYDPHDFTPPGLPSGLIGNLGYTNGRFPVKATNALLQSAYTAYDPIKGVVLQTTDANGIYSCYGYDDLARQTSKVDRCGSVAPLATSIQRFVAIEGSPGAATVVTVTTPPGQTPTWTYTNELGREVATISHDFNGGLVEALTEYDALGRVHRVSKPFTANTQPVYWTTTTYGDFGRVLFVDQDLGVIDDTGAPLSTRVTNTYDGSSITTTQVVSGRTHSRKETKNVLGKVASVTTAITEESSAMISYGYDVDGNLTDTHDPNGSSVQIGYDIRGRRNLVVDPDLGTWQYVSNGFGELISQTDAKNETINLAYDPLSRITSKTSKTDPTDTVQWIYDVVPNGVGKLAAIMGAPDTRLKGPCNAPYGAASDDPRAARWFSYTGLGDVQEVFECADGDTFSTAFEYDAITGRQSVVHYPEVDGSRLSIASHYTSTGFLQYVADAGDNTVYWAAEARNEAGQVTSEFTRNGVETVSSVNPSTGWEMSSTSTARGDGPKVIQGWTYSYDEVGDLLRRGRSDQVNTADSQETFGYDLISRLQSSEVAVPSLEYDRAESYLYDPTGNPINKAGKEYMYNSGCTAGARPGARPAGPHAVCTVGGGAPYQYDDNGNLTGGEGRSIRYNRANKAVEIDKDATVVSYMYGGDGNRVVQDVGTTDGTTVSSQARTVYVGLGDTGRSLYERTTRGEGVEHVHFIYAGDAHMGNAIALKVVSHDPSSGDSVTTKYDHFDRLGSTTTTSDENGHVVDPDWGGPDAGILGYDPWGARRSPDGRAADPTSFNPPVGHREYTGHETIPSVGLVNMNGRIYDPVVGRFLSPDPNVQFVADLQSYNRYSYVLNNPLRYTDPTGYRADTALEIFAGLTFAIEAAATCAVTEGAGCGVAFAIAGAIFNATAMAADGASARQIVTGTALGVFTGTIGGDLGEEAGLALKSAAAGQIVGGAISGALSGTFNAVILGKGNLGEDLLMGAFQGASNAALTWAAAQGGIAVSEAALAASRGEVTGDDWGPKGPPKIGPISRAIPVCDDKGRTIGYIGVETYKTQTGGVDIVLVYKSNVGSPDDLNWVQTVKTNRSLSDGKPAESIDNKGGGGTNYYESPAVAREVHGRSGYDAVFWDDPARTNLFGEVTPDVQWRAQTSLVSMTTHRILVTLSWGFSTDILGRTTAIQLQGTLPSKFQWDAVP